MDNYVAYHVHSDYSLLDSTTDFNLYIERAKQLGQKAICFTEHGNTRGWVAKKMACDAAGIKYLHGVEIYLTESLQEKVRDNYHTILIAKNRQGFLELNKLLSMSTDEDHKYYVGRLSFDEFLNISPNIIKTSACLASPLNKLDVSHPYYEKLVKKYDYLEIQPHDCEDQIVYNRHLAALSQRYSIPLIAATDTHSINQYYAECQSLLAYAKSKHYDTEDDFDLTYKSREELEEAFRKQDSIPEEVWQAAIDNTVLMANQVEEFELDISLKYPILYGSAEEDRERFTQNINERLETKLEKGIIPREQEQAFRDAIGEELRVFTKLGMCGFMQSMSEILTWCHENGIVTGPGRGSVTGSRAAYVTDITDVNSETWHTVFSRFCNEGRIEVGDIDTDVIEDDRPKIFNYIIERFGRRKTAFVPSCGTLKDLATIEAIVRGFRHKWEKQHPESDKSENPYPVSLAAKIKADYGKNAEACKQKYKKFFYYFDGSLNTRISQSVHPAGIVISPVTLDDNYGVFYHKDGGVVLQIDMEEIHEVSLVKYDMLVLNTLQIIRDACKLANIPYPKSHEIDWNDQKVWKDMMVSNIGIFQMESPFAGKMLKDFNTKSIFDMSLVTACIRPGGASYREELIARIPHKNPSPLIDELLKDQYGRLVYQEDIIKFLQEVCGLSGGEADTVRRHIARKHEDELEAALPKILEGYCQKSDKPRAIAEEEAKEFIQVIKDSSRYMFNYNHSISYCLIGFLCAWLRCYHPYEFITSYLNNAAKDEDIRSGTKLAQIYGLKITPPMFGASSDQYMFDPDRKIVSKGISSVKFLNKVVPQQLYAMYHQKKPKTFMETLLRIRSETSCNERQLLNLIRIGFFSEYGNTRELQRIYDIFKFFNDGTAKSIKKTKLKEGPMCEIVKRHATDVGVKGNELKSYTITDMPGLLEECERNVLSLGIEEADVRSRIMDQLELMGYIDITTNDPQDRRKLLVLETFDLNGPNGVWGVATTVRSIGTGNEARLTVRKSIFDKKPFAQYNILFGAGLYKNKKGYWYLNDYKVLE